MKSIASLVSKPSDITSSAYFSLDEGKPLGKKDDYREETEQKNPTRTLHLIIEFYSKDEYKQFKVGWVLPKPHNHKFQFSKNEDVKQVIDS